MRQPAAPRDGIIRERKWPYALLSVAWVGGAFVGVQVVVGVVLALLARAGVQIDVGADVLTTGANALVFSLALAVILGVPKLFKLWSGRIPYGRLVGLTRVMRWRDILFALIGFAVYFAALTLVLSAAGLIPGFNVTEVQNTGFSKTLMPSTALLVFTSLVIIPPIVEEIIFRGYLFGTLRRSVPVWVAAILTSALFGLLHFQWNVGVDVFVLSLVSCFLRYKTGALWASILLHMFKNGLAFYALYVAAGNML